MKNTYDLAAIHVGINNLFDNVKSTNDICNDIIDVGQRCKYISMVFISSIAYRSKVYPASIQQLNGLLFDEYSRNGFKFVDNGAVSEIDLCTGGIHMIESGKRIIANNLINSLSYGIYGSSQLESLGENTLSSEKNRTSSLNSEELNRSEITYQSNSRSIDNAFRILCQRYVN